MGLFDPIFRESDPLEARAKELVRAATCFAIGSFQRIDEKFRLLPVCSLKTWDFFMTVAAVFVAVNSLLSRVPKERFMRLCRVVVQELNAWHPRGFDALEDCRTFVHQSLQRTAVDPIEVRIEDALGIWVLWNIYKRHTTDEESKPASVIGHSLVGAFANWWD